MPKSSRTSYAFVVGAAALTLTANTSAAMAADSSGALETVVVTAQKRSENIQNVPIAISAFTQKDLTAQQIAGGPDLVKEVPNLTFSKTNFTGSNIQIRGIGTQAVSATTDPAVAVAFNNIPFIRNHFFEQEFFDVEDVEVLRGPQGHALWPQRPCRCGQHVVSAKPDRPIPGQRLGRGRQLQRTPAGGDGQHSHHRRQAGVARCGRVDQAATAMSSIRTRGRRIDGRDLWSGRMTLHFEPISRPKRQSHLGAFLRKRRPGAFQQAALRKGPRSFGRRWSGRCAGAGCGEFRLSLADAGMSSRSALRAEAHSKHPMAPAYPSCTHWSCSPLMSAAGTDPMRGRPSRRICASSIRC